MMVEMMLLDEVGFDVCTYREYMSERVNECADVMVL
jgi:hypothetical protein